MKVIIAGSREGFVLEDVEAAILNSGFDITEVVSGTARGVDTLGEIWAEKNGIPVKNFPADWKLHGARAGFVRNAAMARYADALIAVWDGRSPGTRNMIGHMERLGKPNHVHIDLEVRA